MQKLSQKELTNIIITKRKKANMTQQELADKTVINRATISRLELMDFMPSIAQLESLSDVLDFDITDLFVESDKPNQLDSVSPLNIAVAGTGYVGLSLATLLAQHNHVTAVDIVPEKVELINNGKSPIQYSYLELVIYRY